MTFVGAVSTSLLIRAFFMFLSCIFLFVGGTLAWYEVAFRGKNGITLAIRDFLYALGFVILLNTIMTFYASLEPIHNATFLIMTWISTGSNLLALYYSYRLVLKLMAPEEGLKS